MFCNVSEIHVALENTLYCALLSDAFSYSCTVLELLNSCALQDTLQVPVLPEVGDSSRDELTTHLIAYNATNLANTLQVPIVVFTRSGFMASLLSHFRPRKQVRTRRSPRIPTPNIRVRTLVYWSDLGQRTGSQASNTASLYRLRTRCT